MENEGFRQRAGAGEAAPARSRVAVVDESGAGQRVDNFLLRELKGVPRSHVYRLLRGGEVRVNSRRVAATARLAAGDRVRIPPVRVARPAAPKSLPPRDPGLPVVFEDAALLVIDKPAGVAVHGGSGISFGVIERLRHARPQAPFLELVHRLDRETSGLLLVAKKRSALTALHAALRAGRVGKRYLVLVKGRWRRGAREVVLPLRRYLTAAGERRVNVDPAGQESRTRFAPVRAWERFTLLAADLDTGRTHQIRVQLAHLGFPVVGDDKYGDFELNREVAKQGLRRMFLHAAELAFDHPATGTPVSLQAPLPADLERFLAHLDAVHGAPV
jgi:23S rRNA pseudouridine955/2504/2580 synthase